MKRYRRRTPIIEAVLWAGDNIEEIKELCPEAMVDDNGRLWIPAFINMYCVPGPAFITKDTNGRQVYRAYKTDEFDDAFEEVL